MVFQIKPIGNCAITVNEAGRKVISFTNGSSWKKPIIDKKLNGSFIVPNGDYTILDIDDVESEQNKYIMNKFSDSCKFIVRSFRKGIHMYFKHCPEIAHLNVLPKLDIISSGKKMLFCPPTQIETPEGEIKKYKIIKNEQPEEMPEELINYILNRKNELTNNTEALKEKEKELISKNTKKAEPEKIIKLYSDMSKKSDVIEDVLMNLNQFRCDDYNEWIKILMILKNEKYDYSLFETFSKRSNKFDNSVITIWDRYNSNDVKNKLSIASLWHMLKEDNPDAFNKIKKKEMFKDYKFIEYPEEGIYSSAKFIEIFNDDKNQLKSKVFIDDDTFSLTNSYKYFTLHHAKIPNVSYVKINYNDGLKSVEVMPKDYLGNITECFVNVGNTKYSFTSLYEQSANKKIYDKMDFVPADNTSAIARGDLYNKSILNLFNGFKFQKAEVADYDYKVIKNYVEMVEHIIDDKKQSNHFFDWLAHIVQKPSVKQTHCYVFYSFIHGVGKNTLVEGIANILKGYYYKLKNADALTDRFNSEKMGKLFCYGDEIKTFQQGESVFNEIKNIITQSEYSVEFKGKDKITGIKDYCHYLFTTNNKRNFLIEQTERFNMVKCNTKLWNNGDFTPIYDVINTDKFGRNFYLFLMKRDLTNYNPFKATTNEYKKELENSTLPYEIKMLCSIKNIVNNKYIYWSQLYSDLKEMCSSNGKKCENTKDLREILINNYKFRIGRRKVDGELESKIGISFLEDTETGRYNITVLKNLCSDDNDDNDVDEDMPVYD